MGAAISLTTLILSILYLVYGWRKTSTRRNGDSIEVSAKKEHPYLKIVTKAVDAINDRSRLLIKRSNPELKALHHHVVHKRQEYHYHSGQKLSEAVKQKIEELKGRFMHKRK